MIPVDFYILENTNALKSQHFTCGLIEKAYLNQQQVFVFANSHEEAERFDALLWTFKEDSFIPHALEEIDPTPPVVIGYRKPSTLTQVMINLSNDIPPFYQQFSHVIEIVYDDATIQQLARERFRRYRQSGCQLNTHKLKKSELP